MREFGQPCANAVVARHVDVTSRGVRRIYPYSAGRIVITYAMRAEPATITLARGGQWERVHRDASQFNLERLRADGFTHVTLKAARGKTASNALLLDDLLAG